MIIIGLVLACLAALIHVYIFYMESIAWTKPKVRATFGTTEEEAAATKGMAFNRGFYKLFLAILVVVGTVLYAVGDTAVGATLVIAGTGSMAAAALVLILSSPDKRGAALKQGVIPLAGLIVFVIGLNI